MKITGVPLGAIHDIAKALGVRAIEQKSKDSVKILMRPVVGSRTFRAMSVTGRPKASLCLHGQYAFMAHIFARYNDAVLVTWVNTWKLALFEHGAKAWTLNELKERASYDTCDCSPELVEVALMSPAEINAKVSDIVEGLKLLNRLTPSTPPADPQPAQPSD